MLANNETGVVQPVAEAAAIMHAAGGLLHVDAVQGPGRTDCEIGALGADLITLSAHKIGEPKGVGALIRRNEDIHFPEPLIRSGAAPFCRRGRAHMLALRNPLEFGLKAISPHAVNFGEAAGRLPNTTLFAVEGMKAAVIAFDLEGIAVSSGAACSSGKVQPSHVLAATEISPALVRGAVRVSLDWSTGEAEIERLLAAWRRPASALCRGRRLNGCIGERFTTIRMVQTANMG